MLICPSRNVCPVSSKCSHSEPHLERNNCTTKLCSVISQQYRQIVCTDIFIVIMKERIKNADMSK